MSAYHAARLRAALATRTVSSRVQSSESKSDFAGGRQLKGRPVYPYSVIPGGVESAQELKDAVLHDSVVAAHYADFNIAQTHVVRLDADRAMYVSYRLGDRVFWTTKTLTLRKGELLISDGAREARVRCGNRLSETPVLPISPEEPPAKVLTAPEAPVLFTGDYPIAPVLSLIPPPGSPPASPPGGIIPPPIIPIIGGGPPPQHSSTPPPPPPPPPPPVNVPEPGTLGLLATGLILLLGAGVGTSIRRKRRTEACGE